ncbi:hypothetical protein L6164_023695 [Bauhinia variegata]|uniref:Uncharacterized protein n=1 Tax=Bauhinia variegata TaxID=167791 RepID=A0ACB9MIZ8_BAUVA|nr:hypothetical protein L6164_023695 [Bauhinia variegata]
MEKQQIQPFRPTAFPSPINSNFLTEKNFQGNEIVRTQPYYPRTHDFLQTSPTEKISNEPHDLVDSFPVNVNETTRVKFGKKVISSQWSDYDENWVCERRPRGNGKQYDKYYHHKQDHVNCRSKVEIARYESAGIHPRRAKAQSMSIKRPSEK